MDNKLLERFFRGACSPEEVAGILDWFEKEDLDPNQEQELYRLWQQAAGTAPQEDFTRDAGSILANIHEAIDSQEQVSGQAPASGTEAPGPAIKTHSRTWIYKAVAAVVLLASFLWLFNCFLFGEAREVSRLVTLEALPGTRKTIRLEDGSRITLNAGSRISYQQPLGAYKREITLSGEAFFEVAKDSLRPFTVRTGQLTTQALGTSFNIKYRLAAKEVSVALATGSVKIQQRVKAGRHQVASLVPGQQLVYSQAAKGYRVTPYDPVEVLAWREGVLCFKKANLNQVVEQLESWYGVKIELTGKVGDAARNRLYTGTYDNQSLDDVLEGVSFVKDFTFEKKGNSRILHFN